VPRENFNVSGGKWCVRLRTAIFIVVQYIRSYVCRLVVFCISRSTALLKKKYVIQNPDYSIIFTKDSMTSRGGKVGRCWGK